MKIVKLFSSTLFLLLATFVNGQELKLGKVSVAELEQKAHPKDSAATAAILYKRGNSKIEYNETDGFVLVTDVETRIKIYKKDGSEYANQQVSYYLDGNSREVVSFSDAYTYNLVNGKIEKIKVKSDGFFEEVVNKYRGRKKITFPNVKEGSVLEYKYSVRTKNIAWMPDWEFQEEIPVNYSQFSTFVPEYYVFNIRQKGYIFPKIAVEKNQKSMIYTEKERTDGHVVQTSFSTSKVDYLETKTTYLLENIPAMKEEDFVNNINNYRSSLEQELSMIKYPSAPVKVLSHDWESVAKTIYDFDSFGPELNKTGYFEDDLKPLIANAKTAEEKILIILNFAKSKVKWNDYMGYSTEKGVRKAYKEGSGNIGDINLMLTAMLRYSGLEANPVLVSTRSNGISIFPNRTAFNYVIAAVETSNGKVLLDASDKFSAPNILPIRTLNWHGRLIRKDGTSEDVDLIPKKNSNDIVFMSYDIAPEGKITGKIRRQCTDYNAFKTRNTVDGVKEEEYLEKLENKNRKIEISDYSRINEKDVLLPTIETYSFAGNDLCEVIGGKIYINPLLFFANEKNPFKQEVREYPVDFGFPFLDKFNVTIKIPDGFTVETLPAPSAINMEDNVGSFKFNVAFNDNVLQLTVANQINEAIISTEQYEMLKEYYKGLVAKQTEKIVLKKI
ncbi:DUF3857 domain-containing protein [Flavobacterium hungaricum]|uniref:DUF3857 domain-containing protein n=1 Tax=Flavobacterium hungaricum TaxID=2082725 RepID=A0ABR9TP77_9FLAO|nr:DUF3857 domain-containing protein [Flavobacterium hungaricum]MBE8727168.1 DUF3857 domain-containing protein [Flavobacterium hungaricum]